MKTIKLITTNSLKRKEFKDFFNLYGIELVEENPTFTMKEETILLNNNKEIITNIQLLSNLERVYSQSTLIVEFEDKSTKTYTSDLLEGYINLANKINYTSKEIFGWDDIFMLASSGLSLFQISEINSKVSCRQKNLSSFVADFIHYKDRLSTKFNKIEANETIMIDNSVLQLLDNNKYLNSTNVEKSGIKNILKKSLKNGAFFRSSKTRREKNYWLPGLNAGIPLVEKKDEIHEITFAVHDLCHFLIPDIIFNGCSNTENKQIYIIGRMMSEAISLVLADGWFIQNLRDDFEYDYNKREIYPLFKDLDLNNKDILIKTIESMVNYVIKGDDKYLYEITKDIISINKFKNKYDSFFVEDYKWTFINYENMLSRSEDIDHWFETCEIHNKMLTVEDLNDLDLYLSKDEIIKNILDIFLQQIFDEEEFDESHSFSSSFKRYMLGQCLIFSTFKEINITNQFKKTILFSLNKELSIKECLNIKKFFQLYIEELHKMNLIDDDQKLLYKEIYPFFDPSFAFYDKEKSFYQKTIENYYIEL